MYCSPVWCPHFIKDILSTETVQRRATKYILNDFSSDYKSRLTKLNLLPLMMQLEINDIIFLSRILKNHLVHLILGPLCIFVRTLQDHLHILNSNMHMQNLIV